MLRNYLTTIPYTKFVLIEDSVHARGRPVLDFLLKTHTQRPKNKIHYFVFQEPFGRAKNRLEHNNLVLYDCVSDKLGWSNEAKINDLESLIKAVASNDVVFIDSLVHVMYEYGLAETYRILNILKNQIGVHQIATILHQDLIEDKLRIHQLLEHLSTLTLSLQHKEDVEKGRIIYTYKKLGGKVVKQVEEFWFEGENLVTQKIDKVDPKQIIEKALAVDINPETLSTFKIGLSDADKKSRDGLVLPYLPKQENQEKVENGRIFYEFDAVDDWDEEDPDDDLDI
ncbi:elongator complex protein 5 [Diabrotica virgifera virgifera]|uniref:Elongator complex protein 5 n=1 Tax=Diabrotica virgifera virgifera TaxID=50390 RepID=A0ABM5IS40_DIAVI|nr:elongator complex protein 5 [Diabrotica virgifera virgifera]